MTLNKCTICDKETANKCAKCKSAAYCSQECQKLDFPLHKLLCSKMSTFLEHNPRPTDAVLALLFPVESMNPELFWIKKTSGYEFINSSPGMKKYIEDAHMGQNTSRGDHKLEVFMGEGSYGREKANLCISRLMHGYQWTDSGNVVSLAKWVGNIVVLRSTGSGRICQDAYGDVTVADLRFALDFICHGVQLYEAEDVNKFFVRDEKLWMKGVKISCSGDMALLGQSQFRDVLVSRYNDICTRSRHQPTSTISGHMGFELMVMKCGWHQIIREASKSGMKGLAHSPQVPYLMLNAAPDVDNGNWGVADPEKWGTGIDPTVLIVRKDMGDITAQQIEALVAYCKDVLHAAMKGNAEHGCRSTDERKAIVNQYMTLDKFRMFFETFKKKKINGGDESWTDAALPQVPAPERAELPKDIQFQLMMRGWGA
ncbi:hypothetical protein IFR04_004479 [Cadophora malorum]|uniref:MYND-type domain-containing protein n=1 Tax=Cadophora malorum TaxID=108018 RepID=A0A8H7WCI9_9HELO|nr:hypothetical protein IFR04_004479 [Cadophora malorum]